MLPLSGHHYLRAPSGHLCAKDSLVFIFSQEHLSELDLDLELPKMYMDFPRDLKIYLLKRAVSVPLLKICVPRPVNSSDTKPSGQCVKLGHP